LEAHPKRDASPPKRIPPEPQQQEPKDDQKSKQRIPTLMFHYRVFGCLEAVLAVGACCNLLQTVSDAG
jgi:hypothetical protein